MVKNYCTLGKFNLGLLITSALQASMNSRPRLNFTSGTINFHHFPHEQSIFVYYSDEAFNQENLTDEKKLLGVTNVVGHTIISFRDCDDVHLDTLSAVEGRLFISSLPYSFFHFWFKHLSTSSQPSCRVMFITSPVTLVAPIKFSWFSWFHKIFTNMWSILSKWGYSGSLVENEFNTAWEYWWLFFSNLTFLSIVTSI